ncbi:MAG: AMP-binding protein [Spirochaetota bacterium]|jgi:long-chain acyl-CoA synthetase|nr:AMP-binding protein [Spirochaetota bacterium]
MSKKTQQKPWDFLEEFRGSLFTADWPTLPQMFLISTKRYPDRACFTDFDAEKHTLSYTEVLEKVENLALWLKNNGVKKGDHIAVFGKNSPEWATVYLAAGFAGAIIVPIDYGLHDKEIATLLAVSAPSFIFVDEEKYDVFKKSHGEKVFSLSKKKGDYVYDLKGSGNFEMPELAEDDTAAILFTSGTTGNPKGVMLSHKNLVSDCYIAQTNMTIYHTDVFYALLPIHHSYTMLAVFIEALSVGAEIVFGKSMAVTRMLKELKEGKITMLLGVPLLFNKLVGGILKGIREKGVLVNAFMHFLLGFSYILKKYFKLNAGKVLFKSILEKVSLSTIRIAICGGGPLAESVFKVYQALGIDFVQGYGLTETSPIVALNPTYNFKIESVGRNFHPFMEMKILDPDEKGIGEVLIKGPMVMQGYYKMPEETKDVFTEDGWFKTGDLGRLDDEHYLYLAGRAKNMIVTEGGKNVYPEEIENAFQLVTDIEQITVKGYIVDKATKSEGIEALIYPSDDLFKRLNIVRGSDYSIDLVRDEIQDAVNKINKELVVYSRISKITILDEPLEMTTTKKVKRNF